MLTSIRKSIFETNSSSVHAICISKEKPKKLPKKIIFRTGQYGWAREYHGTAGYLYTALIELDSLCQYEEKLKEILDKNSIEYEFYKDKRYAYIDHAEDLREFLKMIFSDEDMLLRFLCSEDSYVETGNDNDSDSFPVTNPDKTKYDVYVK